MLNFHVLATYLKKKSERFAFWFSVILFLLCLGKTKCSWCISKENDYSGAIQGNASVLVVSLGPKIGKIFI